MPGTTDRARALTTLFRARKRILIEQDSDTDGVEEAMNTNLEITSAILSRRTLKRPNRYRNNGFNADHHFRDWINEQKYRVFTHMTRTSFLFATPSPPPLPSVVDPDSQVRA